MYRVRTAGYSKDDPVLRWALPDRVFFACGACHILAHAFLERWGMPTDRVWWIRPADGFAGNHVFVARGDHVFDFHGWSARERYLAHTWRRADRLWPGWRGELVELPRDVLVDEIRSKTFPGLRLREPGQFLHDALPRARRFLDRFPGSPREERPNGTSVDPAP